MMKSRRKKIEHIYDDLTIPNAVKDDIRKHVYNFIVHPLDICNISGEIHEYTAMNMSKLLEGSKSNEAS